MPLYPMIDDRNETPSSYEIMDLGIVRGMLRLGSGTWEGSQRMTTRHLHELKT